MAKTGYGGLVQDTPNARLNALETRVTELERLVAQLLAPVTNVPKHPE